MSSSSPKILSKVKSFDAHTKLTEDFAQKTLTGGILTLIAILFISLLFISEFRSFIKIQKKHEIIVDTSRGEKLDINFDISFPKLPCSWISIDAMDISGELKFDIDHEVYKRTLHSKTGIPTGEELKHDMLYGKSNTYNDNEDSLSNNQTECGSCYGAEDIFSETNPQNIKCCNTCDEVRKAFEKRGWQKKLNHALWDQCQYDKHHNEVENSEKGEGCQLRGSIKVNRVAGNFHIAPGRSYQKGNMHIHDLKPFQSKSLDFTHKINYLNFGPKYPGMNNALDKIYIRQKFKAGMFQYYIKVVPTKYKDINNRLYVTNQYSVTEHFQNMNVTNNHLLPGVFFFYDISPIKVDIIEYRESYIRFVTTLCVITGGIFTVSGMLDGAIYHGQNALKRKIQLGKFS